MENRVDKAARLFKEGYNCAQAVFAAFSISSVVLNISHCIGITPKFKFPTLSPKKLKPLPNRALNFGSIGLL